MLTVLNFLLHMTCDVIEEVPKGVICVNSGIALKWCNQPVLVDTTTIGQSCLWAVSATANCPN